MYRKSTLSLLIALTASTALCSVANAGTVSIPTPRISVPTVRVTTPPPVQVATVRLHAGGVPKVSTPKVMVHSADHAPNVTSSGGSHFATTGPQHGSTMLLKQNANGAITRSAIDHYVALNHAAGRTITLTPAMGKAKFSSELGKINEGIRGGQYKLVVVGNGKSVNGRQPVDNSGTIVIGQDENGKTVYVSSSKLSGTDQRTIDVNCTDCKIIIVGDKSGTDTRKINVDGASDKVIIQGDNSNGRTGQNGGTVNDSRQIAVAGKNDQVVEGGDSSNGGNGSNGKTGINVGNGGNGGTVNDSRQTTVTGNNDKVTIGNDTANGGNGGNGNTGINVGNGGNGGTVNVSRQTTVTGNNDQVAVGGISANGGNGGNDNHSIQAGR